MEPVVGRQFGVIPPSADDDTLFKLLFSAEALEAVFQEKFATTTGKGIDRLNGFQFYARSKAELTVVSEKIISGRFRFTPYLEVLRSKSRDKKPRLIAIPTVRDRVVMHQLNKFLAAKFPERVPKSLASTYVRELSQGLQVLPKDTTWICTTDIETFYDDIQQARLLWLLRNRISCEAVNKLIGHALATPTVPKNTGRARHNDYASKGIPQGLAISNILASIYMQDVDDAMKDAGVPAVLNLVLTATSPAPAAPSPELAQTRQPARKAPRAVGALAWQGLRSWAADWLLAWVVPLLLLALWSVCSHYEWIALQVLPSPLQVWTTLVDLTRSGELLDNLQISAVRVLYGFGIGASVGLALGVGLGLSRSFNAYVFPLFKAISQVPVIGWLPLLMLLVGIDEALKFLLIAKAALVPVAVNTCQGIQGVANAHVEVAKVFRFTRWQLLSKVVFPAATAQIWNGLRYGFTHAWLALVVVELLASSEGIGFMIVYGRQLFQLDIVLAAVVVVGVLGYLIDKLLGAAESHLLRWRKPGL